MPKISVIICIYNAEKYLRQCLDSIVNQTLKDIEIICVNDGSTDSSKDILEEYANKDKRVVIVNQSNLYAGAARNTGIKLAKGEYIHFMDSDDWIKNNTYEYLYKQLSKKAVDVIIFQYDKVSLISGKIIPCRQTLLRDNQISNVNENPNFFLHCSAVPWNKIYRKDFILQNNLKFDTNLICANDRSYFINCILAANKIMVSKKSFVYYRMNNKESLVGKTRLKNYECHFISYESVKNICDRLKPSINIRKIIIDITMKDFFYYYHESSGEDRKQIYEKLHDYFQKMDVSLCQKESDKYIWWKEYIAIKNGDLKEVEEEFEINSISANDKESLTKYRIKKVIKYIKKYGVIGTIRIILLNKK